ncbi:peptidylprolyl isomerase [Shimia litoralis]|uniref:Parvulin-like PPIase n=2 Tax=Shimia litoralis TaxID=420403 RepID=A0A4U7N5E7_9RHOB|nr:peptidylprolyl isomerase [Shimia litoralis]
MPMISHKFLTRLVASAAFGLALSTATVGPTFAQSAFSPAVTVNDRVVTHYEIEQRALLLSLMNTPGDKRKVAKEQLIEDRLKQEAAEIIGIMPSEEGIQAGLVEFSKRTNLKPEDLIKALEAEGVSEQTLRAFLIAELSWRGVIQSRFAGRVQISEAEIDRAIASNSGAGGINVLLSEIVIPVTPQTNDQVQSLALQISEIRSQTEFEAAAVRYSQASTKDQGGKIDWISITKLPAPLRPMIMGLAQSEVTPPISLPNSVALFQMRGMQETGGSSPSYSAIDYAAYYLPGGRSAETLQLAKELRDRVDTCDDLYGEAYGQSKDVLDRQAVAPSKVPRDYALELAKLDENEISTSLTRPTSAGGQALVVLMLCGRTAVTGEEVSREDVASALRSQRYESYSNGYLEQLRADALIYEK